MRDFERLTQSVLKCTVYSPNLPLIRSFLNPSNNFWRQVSTYSWFLALNSHWKLRMAFLFRCRHQQGQEYQGIRWPPHTDSALCLLSRAHLMRWHSRCCSRTSLAHSAAILLLGQLCWQQGSSFPHNLTKTACTLDLSVEAVLLVETVLWLPLFPAT